ncbi:hypothetical protein ALC57_02517 [Trachymyrmex cornetzi]|uniref:Uncharacterized protein n=1 Tax=Trachymyrmex cornetzi TaxID=471704 RepID=A0A195EIT8_9HYME|nr:hypothetical protein ALC57_02517 [Trachymyrmex cornetzi]
MPDKDAANEGEHFRPKETLAKIDCPELKLDIFACTAVVLLLQQQPPASNIPRECAHYLSMQPYRYRFDLSRRPMLPRHAIISRELSRRDGKSSTESFIDHSTINRTSWRLFLGGTAIRYVSTLDEADLKPWPLVIDHRVTVPLPNFKYAHTSQLVTTNYLGRLLALEEAI